LPDNAAHVFSLADLILRNTMPRFKRTVRKLVQVAQEESIAAGPPARRFPGTTSDEASKPAPKPDPWEGCEQMPVRRGVRWNEIHIHYVDGETVAVKAPGYDYRRWTYVDMGMATKKGRKLVKRWRIFIKLCEQSGSVLDWHGFGHTVFRPLSTQISELRRNLQYIFHLDDDPIPVCSKEKGVRSEFIAHHDAPGTDMFIDQSEWTER